MNAPILVCINGLYVSIGLGTEGIDRLIRCWLILAPQLSCVQQLRDI